MLRTPVLPTPTKEERSRPHAGSKASSKGHNWECTKCTMINDANNLNCKMCMNKNPGQKINLLEEEEKAVQRGSSFSVRLKSLFSKAPSEWECPRCTFVNTSLHIQCQSCRLLCPTEITSHDGGSSVDKEQRVVKKTKTNISEEASSTVSVFDSIKSLFRRRSSVLSKGGATAENVEEREVKKKEVKEREEKKKELKEREMKKREVKKKEVKEEEERMWECQQCTLQNPNSIDKCSACELPRNFDKRPSPNSSDVLVPVKTDSTPQKITSQHQSKELPSSQNVDREHTGLQPFEDVLTPLPEISTSPKTPLEQLNLLSSQGAPTWRCEVCGAYNVVMKTLRQCYICGIGVIPECYLPMSPMQGKAGISSHTCPQAAALPFPHNHNPSPQSHNQQDFTPKESINHTSLNSTDQDYVNITPYLLQNHKPLQHSSNHHSSPPHPLTHINHFEASPYHSPQHTTRYNDRVLPQEPLYINPLEHNPLSNSWESPIQESYIDPYSRPRTPPDMQNSRVEEHAPDRHRVQYHRQHSDEGGRARWMEASVHANRTRCLKEIRHEDVLHANSVYQTIQQYSRENGEPFTDPDFPPADKSLYINPRQPVSRWRVGKWERPARVRDAFDSSGIEWTVVRNARPEDIAQGVLGNCWVLSALGVVAEQPQLIEDIIITKKYSPEVGAYQVRLCRDGKWEVVVVDDCFPCLETGQLVFSKAHRKQLWVPLIEKALAKLHGSYESLNAGKVLQGLSMLTGLPCEKIYLKKKGSEIDPDLVWARLLSFRERGFPMSASCGGEGEEESEYVMKGLESNHAYSILDVRQLGNDRLVRLRNPWGKYSWKGSWSDNDSRWNSHPLLREELQAVGGEAGVFWMGADDFFKYFCEVDVCKYRPNWYSLRSEGKLLPYAARQIKTLSFEVHTTTEVDISIYQPSTRGRSNYYNLVDLAVLVLHYPNTHAHDPHQPSPLPIACSLESGSYIQSIVTTDGFLHPGRYVILPLAFNHYRHPTGKRGHQHVNGVKERRTMCSDEHESEEGAIPYVVAVFSAQELVYESVTTRPGFLPESLMLLAEKIGKVTQPFPNMFLYEVHMNHSCRYLVAANLDDQLHFSVTCDCMDSVNVICSRGDMYTHDCIPPRHRQVLWVLSQLESSARYSVLMRISSSCTQLNSEGQWGAHHSPPLNPTNTELHAPRLIS